jgi:hypothetical protein
MKKIFKTNENRQSMYNTTAKSTFWKQTLGYEEKKRNKCEISYVTARSVFTNRIPN